MKRAYLLLAFACVAASGFAQQMIDRAVGDFHTVKVFDLIEVNLIQSDQNKVLIKGENSEDVKIVNDNGTLRLRMQLEKRFDGSQTFIEVYFTHLDIIDANEGSLIVANEMIAQNTIELRSQEGGRIRAGLKVNHAKIKAVTGGIVEVSGLAESQEITLNTGGIFEGRELQTKDTEISVTAAGEAQIYASQQAKVRVTAGGDVHIYGNPERVDQKSFAGGRIVVIDQ